MNHWAGIIAIHQHNKLNFIISNEKRYTIPLKDNKQVNPVIS